MPKRIVIQAKIPIGFKSDKDIEAMLDIRVTCEGSKTLHDGGQVRNLTMATHTCTEWMTSSLVNIHRQVSNDDRNFQVERTLQMHIVVFTKSKETYQ